jgi:hypothetical protein
VKRAKRARTVGYVARKPSETKNPKKASGGPSDARTQQETAGSSSEPKNPKGWTSSHRGHAFEALEWLHDTPERLIEAWVAEDAEELLQVISCIRAAVDHLRDVYDGPLGRYQPKRAEGTVQS